MEAIRVTLDEGLQAPEVRDDLLSRLAWAGAGAPVEIEVEDPALYSAGPSAELPDYFDEKISGLLSGVRFVPVPKDEDVAAGTTRLVSAGGTGEKKDRSVFVANRFDRAEGMDLSRLRFTLHRRQLRHLKTESLRKLNRFRESWSCYEKSYVIATGPSFREYKGLTDFENHFVVTCNSAVINEEFMKAVNPDLLVFGDPIFHFGPSKYAADFREKLREVASRYEFKIAVTERYYFIFRYSFPELMDRTVFVPTENQLKDFHWRFEERFEVKGTQNVLTQLMLPFAAWLTDEISIIGCDGRMLKDDSYFWGHDPSAQINDKMRNIQDAHPGFFGINYNSYFLTHCQNLENFFRSLEWEGIHVKSGAFSYIPALGNRAEDPELGKSYDRETEVALTTGRQRHLAFAAKRLSLRSDRVSMVSINPSLKNGMGHALYQDASMRDFLGQQGGELVSLGSEELIDDLADDFVLPCFRDNVWKIHRARGREREALVKDFVDELFDGLEALTEVTSLEDATIFFYLGHPAILPELIQRWSKKQFVCEGFTFNLFSGYFAAPSPWEERSQWAAISAAALAVESLPDFSLTFDSHPLARDFEAIEGITLPLLPMCPSQSFPGASSSPNDSGKLRVVYPSQAEAIRGYEVICEFLEDFAEDLQDRFEFVIRSFAPWKETGAPKAECEGVEWVEGELSEEAYRDLLTGADIILLPYSPDFFHYRTSSILAEAFSLGKPVITTSGSWLGFEVDQLGAGWCCDLWNGQGIRDALEQAWNDREVFAKRFFEGPMRSWCEENQVDVFVESIREAGSPLVKSDDATLEAIMRRLVFHEGGGGRDLEEAKKKQARIEKNRRQNARPPKKVALATRVSNRIRRIGKQPETPDRPKRKKARQPKKAGLKFESLVDGYAPGERIFNGTALLERYQLAKGLRADSAGGSISEWLAETESSSASPACFLAAAGEEERVEEAARKLEQAGYQVFVVQEHPGDEGGFFRLFPFPSQPISADVKNSLLAFSTFVRDEQIAQWVEELWAS